MSRPSTMTEALIAEDWSDLTVPEIAEVLETSSESIRALFWYIKINYGVVVPYKRRHKVCRKKKNDAA